VTRGIFIYLFKKIWGEFLPPRDKKEKASTKNTKAFFFFTFFFFGKEWAKVATL